MSSTLNLERTVALIKPHAIRHRFNIVRRIQMSGFHILEERYVKLTVEQASEYLKGKSSDCQAPLEISNLSSGPLIVLCLARENAIELWQRLMGPEIGAVAKESSPMSLRALFSYPDDDSMNAVCGSKSADDVRRELHFFFPNMIQEPIYTTERINNYLCSSIYQPLTDALYEITKVKPDDPLEWLAVFMLERNNSRPVIHEAIPNIMQQLMEMKAKEDLENKKKESKDDMDDVPAKCGCSLPKTSSITSSTTSRCCNIKH